MEFFYINLNKIKFSYDFPNLKSKFKIILENILFKFPKKNFKIPKKKQRIYNNFLGFYLFLII